MYYIEIHTEPNHIVSAEFNIPADIVIFNRQSIIDDKLVDVSIGMTVCELIETTKRIKYWDEQKKLGIDPPKNKMKQRESESYMDEM
jgi:hypothetical protein